jgi:serine/threonine-protein kinase HipA
MKLRKGRVKIDGKTVGIVEEIPGGHRFTYSAAWLKRPDATPISLTMPLREEPYFSKELHPFFAGLLPFGLDLEVASRRLHISIKDQFGLMLNLCEDCRGCVEVEQM